MVDTIRAWVGHVSINTTNIFAEVDLEMKAKALGVCAVKNNRLPKRSDLMSFLAQI
jgi:integrase/recombinase XerD